MWQILLLSLSDKGIYRLNDRKFTTVGWRSVDFNERVWIEFFFPLRRRSGMYWRKKKLLKRKSLVRSSTPRLYSDSLWLWSFEALSRLYLSGQISGAPRGRNDFRNMINCPTVAFRRRRGFQTNCGLFSTVVSLCGMCLAIRNLFLIFPSFYVPMLRAREENFLALESK